MTDFLHRQQRAVKLLSEHGLQALLLQQRENLRYFCGFTGTDGALLVTSDGATFLTDSRYTTQAGDEVSANTVREYKVKTDGLIEAIKLCGAEKIGFEGQLSYAAAQELQERGANHWHWLALKEPLAALRLIKDAQEVAAIKQATALNLRAFDSIKELIRPGISEHEIAIELEYRLKKEGAEEKAFDFIVASGERGALPHGVASQKTLQNNELVTIDFGCRVAGYYSDETVTVAIGEVSAELRKIHDTVLEAHDRAVAAIRPGTALIEIDRVARDYIAAAGYGDYFGHGLGHGVGLEVHEAPVVSPRAKLVAEQGMIFTIEPGIYIPGTGGVRIEDMVFVTEEGCRCLTSLPKTFRNILVN